MLLAARRPVTEADGSAGAAAAAAAAEVGAVEEALRICTGDKSKVSRRIESNALVF